MYPPLWSSDQLLNGALRINVCNPLEGVGAGRQESTGISKIQQPPQSLIGRPLPAYIANFARDAGRQESIGISKRPLPAYITNFDAHRIPAWDPTGIRLHVLPGSRTAVRGTALNPRFGRRSGRKSPFLPLRPPQHETSPRAASSGAAKAALVGLIHAVQEDDPREVALLTVRAIATAVSTSRSYGAFVAATTTLEKGAFALQAAELDHTRLCSPERVPCLQEAIEIGTNDGLAADAGTIATGQWPFNIHDAYPFGSPWTWTSAGSSTAGPPTPPTPET